MNPPPSTEDRIWAALAHLSALVTGMGLPLPIVGWAEQRRKSKYASFQCLQALGYQSLGFTIWILFTLLVMLVLVFALIGALGLGEQNNRSVDVVATIWAIVIFVVMLVLIGLYFMLPIIAAVACAMGKDFRYPFMGARLARYLDLNTENEVWLNEDHGDRWVAAMGHFSVIIALWGMLAPLAAWIVQGKRSAWLKFQSAQALALQVIVLLLSAAAGGVYLFGFFLFVVLIGFGENAVNSPGGMAGLAILIVSMLVAALIVLIVPLFHIMGQWAGYRVLKGDDYMYPLIGKIGNINIPRIIGTYTGWLIK